jgi:hypothetical protein
MVTRERGQDQPVGWFQTRSWLLTTQHRVLMAKQYQLDVLGLFTATTNHDQRQQPADDGIGEGEYRQTTLTDGVSATVTGVFERHKLRAMINDHRPEIVGGDGIRRLRPRDGRLGRGI